MTPDDLRKWRAAEGLTAKDAAALLGISERRVYYLEAGRTSGGTEFTELPKLIELAWQRITKLWVR